MNEQMGDAVRLNMLRTPSSVMSYVAGLEQRVHVLQEALGEVHREVQRGQVCPACSQSREHDDLCIVKDAMRG